MKTDVLARGLALTQDLRSRIDAECSRLQSAFPERLRVVSVRLFDVNGTRGGSDKGCLIYVKLGSHRSVVVATDIHADPRQAIAGAFGKLERTMRSALSRSRRRARTHRDKNDWIVEPTHA